MSHAYRKGSRNRISMWNWLGTLALMLIPGVNIIALFLFLFLGKAQPKRSFALAGLLLIAILAILTLLAFIFFPAQLLRFAEDLRPSAESLVSPSPTPFF